MAKKKKKKPEVELKLDQDVRDHYIDNKKFYEEMIVWKKLCIEAEESDEPRPPITNYIGECFMNIAEHLSRKVNFMNYPYREEMVSDGIENCLMYAHNFDPEKSKNPFSYFTQIIYYAFLRRIEKEKKQAYIKLKMTEIHDDGNSYNVNIGSPKIGALLDRIRGNNKREYLIIGVRPSGFQDFKILRSRAESLGVTLGYEPIDFGWRIRAPGGKLL